MTWQDRLPQRTAVLALLEPRAASRSFAVACLERVFAEQHGRRRAASDGASIDVEVVFVWQHPLNRPMSLRSQRAADNHRH